MSSTRRIRFSDEKPDRYDAVQKKVRPEISSERNKKRPPKKATNNDEFIPNTKRQSTKEERAASRAQMEHSYRHIMDTYAQQQKMLDKKPGWVASRTKDSMEPDELTVTHVNQTNDLLTNGQRVGGNGLLQGDKQTSAEWLESHSIKDMQLTLKDLVDKGTVAMPATNKQTGRVQQRIQFEAATINEFEYKLNLAIESYTTRIKWLLQGSRRIFGLIKGNRIGVMIDASDANFGFGRLAAFQDAITHLLDEQLSKKKGIYMMCFGSELCPLWNNVRDVGCRSGRKLMEEAKAWVDQLEPSGGSNVLKAFKHMFKVKNLDTVILIQGSAPDQPSDMLCSYVEQLGIGVDLPIQTVAYDCNNHTTQMTLKRLAENSSGRYHCYASTSEEQLYTGSDISSLLAEIQNAQDVINKIKEMRQGLLGTALVSVMNEISSEVAKLPQSRFLPRPPGHELPLNVDMPKFLAASSSEWLSKHGLKAKGLDLYQVLSPNAYSYKEEFIPVIRKTVQSQVHEKAMTQFQWHDGTMRNIHVDLTQLFEYQKQLGAMVKIYEKRIDWLSSASRKIFGTLSGKNVVILVDLSVSNANYLVHLQHSLRLLMEQQLANKEYFNIIGFGSEAKKWRPTMSKPTPQNLQAAWKWILDTQCVGSRNFMDAFRVAVENDEEAQHGIEVEGVYLFTSGIPDQAAEVCCPYVEEACAGRNLALHVVLFNVDDYDAQGAIVSRYANITKTAECLRNMSHCSNGRFHWFRETGIIESDDIASINLEIEKALNFSKKCAMLVDSIKKKYNMETRCSDELVKALPPGVTHRALPPAITPKSRSHVTSKMVISELEQSSSQTKAITWRPSSAKRPTSASSSGSTVRQRPTSAKDPMQRVKPGSSKRIQQAFFFTDDKHSIGSVFNKYPLQRPKSGKPIKAASIPEKEEQLASKEWMRMYSLGKLKLDLRKMATGPECKHVTKATTGSKSSDSRVCAMFPSVNIDGVIRHIQLRPIELKEYEGQVEHVVRRYIKRLQWLLSGSRRVFGTIVEKRVSVLIDTSGSMDPYMEELRKELVSLIWDQLYRHKVKFNFIQFSGVCCKWRDVLAEPTEQNCHEAVKWVSELMANGNTCTLDALEHAFNDNIDAIYLLTDGKPDTSTSLVLREVARMNANRSASIHTISFNCEDSTANTFLKMLSNENRGRFHRCHSDFDAALFAHKLLTEGFDDHERPHLPDFEGDDMKRLGNEIGLARRFITQSKQYRARLESNKTPVC